MKFVGCKVYGYKALKSILILLCLFCFSCSSLQSEKLNDFEEVVAIVNYDSLYSDKEQLFGPVTDMEISDGIIALSHRNDKYNFSFINANNGQLLNRWGKIGEGPDEFLDFGGGFIFSDSTLVFMEQMKKNIVYVHVSDILKQGSVAVKREKFPYNVDFRPVVFTLSCGFKFFGGAFSHGRLGIMDDQDSIRQCPFDYPFSTAPLDGLFRGNVYQCRLKSSEDEGKFVVQTFYSDIFEIFQCTGDSLSRVYVSPFSNPPQVVKRNNRYGLDYDASIMGLGAMAVSDELICFLYSPLSVNEFDRQGGVSNEVLCFDWMGNKVRKYILPFPINAFCVDEHYLYGMREYEDESVLYRFPL